MNQFSLPDYVRAHHRGTVLIGATLLGVVALISAWNDGLRNESLTKVVAGTALGGALGLHAFGGFFASASEGKVMSIMRWGILWLGAAFFFALVQITYFQHDGLNTPAARSYFFWIMLDWLAALFLWILLRLGGASIDVAKDVGKGTT